MNIWETDVRPHLHGRQRERRNMKTKKTRYDQIILIPPDVADTIQRYLNATTEEDFQGEDNTISYTAKFPDGMAMDVQCCGCQDESSWTQAVLFNQKGGECGCTEPKDKFFDTWDIETEDTVYCVEVKSQNEEEK